MNKSVFGLLVLLIILSGCNRKVGLTFFKREKLEVVNPKFEYLSAKAKFKFDHEEKGFSASANFRIQKDSIIWISISPGMGIEAARVLIDTEEVKVIDKINKKYYEYTFEQLSESYKFDFSYQMIQSVMLGNSINPYSNQPIEKSPEYFQYKAQQGPYTFLNFIGANTMKLEKVRVTEDSTQTAIAVDYRDFMLVDDQIFPREIDATIDYQVEGKANTEIEISYNKMQIEEAKVNFPFSVPSRYERK